LWYKARRCGTCSKFTVVTAVVVVAVATKESGSGELPKRNSHIDRHVIRVLLFLLGKQKKGWVMGSVEA